MSERRNKQDRTDGLVGVVGLTAAAMVIPVVGVFFALRGAVVGLSRLRASGGRLAGAGLVLLAGVAMVAQIGHAQLLVGCGPDRSLQGARQAVCASNLKQLGLGLRLYQEAYNGSMPMLRRPDGSAPRRYSNYPGRHETAVGFYASEAGCNLQTLWLPVAEGFCEVDQFGCPGDSAYTEPEWYMSEVWGEPEIGRADGWGFDSWNECSYAFQPFTPHEDNAARPGREEQHHATVIAADKRTPEMADVENPNHGRVTVALEMDGSVEVMESVIETRGWRDNNLYVRDLTTDGGLENIGREEIVRRAGELPVHVNDSVLYWGGSHVDFSGQEKGVLSSWGLLIGAVLVAGALLLGIRIGRRDKPSAKAAAKAAAKTGDEPPRVPN